MKTLRVCLAISMLVAGLAVPQVAGAATVKVRTRLVFEEEDSGRWYEGAWVRGYYSDAEWSLDATSVPSRTITGRLMYYRTSDRKWVPYKYRLITLETDDTYRIIKSNFAGNFKVTLDAPRVYSLYYPGHRYSQSCSANLAREDWADTECTSTLTTSSVDASHTRVSVNLDYRYNPYVDWISDPWLNHGSQVVVRSTLYVGDDGGGIANVSKNWYEEDIGIGTVQWSYVLPNETIDGRELRVGSRVEYLNEWIHSPW